MMTDSIGDRAKAMIANLNTKIAGVPADHGAAVGVRVQDVREVIDVMDGLLDFASAHMKIASAGEATAASYLSLLMRVKDFFMLLDDEDPEIAELLFDLTKTISNSHAGQNTLDRLTRLQADLDFSQKERERISEQLGNVHATTANRIANLDKQVEELQIQVLEGIRAKQRVEQLEQEAANLRDDTEGDDDDLERANRATEFWKRRCSVLDKAVQAATELVDLNRAILSDVLREYEVDGDDQEDAGWTAGC